MGACDLPAEIRTKPRQGGFAFIALLSGQACLFDSGRSNHFIEGFPSPAVSADSVLLGDTNQRYSSKREQWSNRSPGEGNKSQQPAKHRPDNRMKTEQERFEQVEPDGLNFKQQSPDNVYDHRAAGVIYASKHAPSAASRASFCYPPLAFDGLD